MYKLQGDGLHYNQILLTLAKFSEIQLNTVDEFSGSFAFDFNRARIYPVSANKIAEVLNR